MINYGLRTRTGKITKDVLRYYVLLQYYTGKVFKYKNDILKSIDNAIKNLNEGSQIKARFKKLILNWQIDKMNLEVMMMMMMMMLVMMMMVLYKEKMII